MKIFYIFSLAFIVSVQGNVLKCNLREGGQGQCKPVKDCEMCQTQNFVFYPDHFCPGDFSLICCDMTITAPNRILATTKAPPIAPPLNVKSFENHPSYKLLDMENCGELTSAVKIANGEIAQVLEFPWNVLIGYEQHSEIMFRCGGTLISSK
jgi:hypothetical protein